MEISRWVGFRNRHDKELGQKDQRHRHRPRRCHRHRHHHRISRRYSFSPC